MNYNFEFLSKFKIRMETAIPGLRYIDNFISEEEEKQLLEACNNGVWSDALKRKVQHYGYVYSYKSKQINKKDCLGPLPNWCNTILEKLTALGLGPFDQMIVNHYLPGQGISGHIDSPTMFKDTVVSISLGSDIIMDFEGKLVVDGHISIIEQYLKRRSVVILQKEARYNWKHEIRSRKNDVINGKRVPRGVRISLTFRTVL